ncbi:MAG TPA: DUF4252 domain-containing protein [Acidobacteriaceae bacterium]|nr:DUF4252 domain-containing protein [Acidobacteriaceae bacterium]
MKKVIIHFVLLLTGLLPFAALRAAAQSPDEPPFPVTIEKQLATRASNYTEVTLDRKMLDFASRFMNNEDDAEGKRIIAKLNGIYVRTYEFDKPGQYTAEDLAAIRRQFQTADWNPIVKQRSKDGSDDSDIYLKVVNGDIQGMFILNSEPKELNFVYISGPIRPEDLDDIDGNFGIHVSEADKQQMKKDAKQAAKDATKVNKEAQQP